MYMYDFFTFIYWRTETGSRPCIGSQMPTAATAEPSQGEKQGTQFQDPPSVAETRSLSHNLLSFGSHISRKLALGAGPGS